MLLIGSVCVDHVRSKQWYELQTKYLKRTTKDFVHVVYLNGVDDFYHNSDVIKVDDSPAVSVQHSHIRGLNYIIDYFNASSFDSLLLLDSDGFPIQKGWCGRLLSSMGETNVAAVVRYENLDVFAHTSVFFVHGKCNGLRFDIKANTNMAGFTYSDSAPNVTSFFPLIRTNRLNHHQVLCGIYNDFFYHHGAGSRNVVGNLCYSYLNKGKNFNHLETNLFEQLMCDSDGFIDHMLHNKLRQKLYL